MTLPSRPCLPRTTRVLLICGLLWITLCWSFVLVSLSSSLSLHESSSHAPPRPDFPANQNRHLSSSESSPATPSTISVHEKIAAEVKGHTNHLRAHKENTAPSQPKHEDAPLTTLTYPLHAKSGTHHAFLYVGTPAQRQTLIVDTGSRLTAFPCEPHCPRCGKHASSQFQLNKSSTHEVVTCEKCKLDQVDYPEYPLDFEDYHEDEPGPGLRGGPTNGNNNGYQRSLFPKSCVNNQCELDQKYTEGSSWKAIEVQDKVWLGLDDNEQSIGEHARYSAPFTFGCQTSESGLFKTQYADGIMGLAMYTHTLVGSFLQYESISHASFSLCLNQKGGHISLGGTGLTTHDDPSSNILHVSSGRHILPMLYTPLAKDNVWYYTVTVTSVKVGEHVLPKSVLQYVNDFKGTIIDSGTTDTFIHSKVAKPFIHAWEKITRRPYHNRLQGLLFEDFNKLPVITFELKGGIEWEIAPGAYMEASDALVNGTEYYFDPSIPWEGKRRFTSRIYVDEPQGVVLGSNAMMDKEIYFDVANRRLGVAKAICAY